MCRTKANRREILELLLMIDGELKWFFFSEKEKAFICQVLVEENRTGKVCGAQVKMLMDGKQVKKPTSNMKRHVKKTHGALHLKIVQEQEKKKAAQKRTANVSDVNLSKN